MIEVVEFSARHRAGVVELILSIQQEFDIPITLNDQPDLLDIPGFYQQNRGNFWVALADTRVVGTIALQDIGNAQGALQKCSFKRRFLALTTASPDACSTLCSLGARPNKSASSTWARPFSSLLRTGSTRKTASAKSLSLNCPVRSPGCPSTQSSTSALSGERKIRAASRSLREPPLVCGYRPRRSARPSRKEKRCNSSECSIRLTCAAWRSRCSFSACASSTGRFPYSVGSSNFSELMLS